MLETLKSLRALISPLSAFFIGALFTCAAYGSLSSYLAVRLNGAHVPTFYSGIILSVYYIGYIWATLSAYSTINKAGHIRAFSAYISILSALVLLHALYFNPWYWGFLRFLEGYCLASALICLESWLNTRSNNKNRGVIMSIYMIISYLGAAFGQLMLNIPDATGFIVFTLISIFFSVALVPVSLTALPTPDISKHRKMSLKQLYQKTPVGVAGCITSGILVGGIYTLGAIYADKSGLNLRDVSLFMFFTIMGGMLAQMPVGRLSDKMDRRYVMVLGSGILFLIAPWLHLFIGKGLWGLILSSLFLGAGTFILYPICVSHVNDKIEDDERVEASGMLLLLQGIGMIIGPVIMAYLMQHFGAVSFLISFAAANGVFVLFTIKQISIKPNIDYITVTKTDPMPFTPTQMFTQLATDDSLIDKAKEMFVEKKE